MILNKRKKPESHFSSSSSISSRESTDKKVKEMTKSQLNSFFDVKK